jgi:HEAT repeat protein
MVILLVAAYFGNGTFADDTKPASKKKAAVESGRPKSLAEARQQAQVRRAPILVIVLSEEIATNANLAAELKAKAAAKEIARYVVVEMSAERVGDELRLWQVESLPGLCLLTPMGRWAATYGGKKSADEITAWLTNNYAAAANVPADDLTKDAAPDPAIVKRLVKEFASRDAPVREAALRRLMPHPKAAARAVVETFVEGPLQARLTAIEALQAWGAPLDGLVDPWNAESHTPPRIATLRKWADQPEVVVVKEMTVAERAQVRDDFDRLIQSDDASATAVRERLARFGTGLMPDVLERLKNAPNDLVKSRLTSLRYRLAATGSLALRWPDGFDRLASPKQTVRHQAVKDLESMVGARDEALLLELFASPDAFVREISLRILHKASAATVSQSLVKLLYDPDANVRAAVLKQMLDAPPTEWTTKLVEYIRWEKDTELTVNAVRVLREIGSKEAAEAMLTLLTHSAWQVRAESVEGLTKLRGNVGTATFRIDEAAVKLIDDPDGYVAGKALTLLGANASKNLTSILALAERHPEVTVTVVETLAKGAAPNQHFLPHQTDTPIDANLVAPLRKFASHTREEVRGAAITSLLTSPASPARAARSWSTNSARRSAPPSATRPRRCVPQPCVVFSPTAHTSARNRDRRIRSDTASPRTRPFG